MQHTPEVIGPPPSRPRPSVRGSRVLVTGGAGFIGSHVVGELLADGAQVAVIDNVSSGSIDRLSDLRARGLTTDHIHIHDIRSPESVRAIVGFEPQVVVHLAAQADLAAAASAPTCDAETNILGTINVLNAAARAGAAQVIYAASAAMYGQVDGSALPVTESVPLSPTSSYGLSKATGLAYGSLLGEQLRVPFCALAFGNVYGPGQTTDRAGVIPRMARAVAASAPVRIAGDGTQTRDFVHIDDVADAVLRACGTRQANGELINIASGVETSVNDIFAHICAAARTAPDIERVVCVAGEVDRMVMSIHRASEVLDWRPRVPLSTGIADIVHAEITERKRP